MADHTSKARADLKKDIKARRKYISDVLDNPPDYVMNMPIFKLLLAIPRQGTGKVHTLLSRERITSTRTVGELSPRQRAVIAAFYRR